MNDYSKNWKTAESFEKKGLTASALAEVMKIFNLAVASGNDVQQIKACMYQMKYRNMVEEDNNENNIFFLDTLIAKTKAPAKNILQSMQAELFLTYRQNNRYIFYGRTTIVEENSKDITTWSIDKLNASISSLYKASLNNETLLKNTSLNGMDAILQKGVNTRDLRPTLYDFIAHRALAYFTNNENDINQPAYKFILNDEIIFAPAKSFINAKLITKDSSSLYYQAILLFQDILRFHINDTNPDALLDADLLRLAFVNEHGIFTNKDKLYENALQHIEASYPGNNSSARAMFLRASLYQAQGLQYDPATKKLFQYDIKKAKELCDLTISKFPKSEGAVNAQNLLAEIKQPFLELETEKVNVPGQPFRSLVKYKNITRLYLRAIKTSREEIKKINNIENDKNWNAIVNLKAEKSWEINLPDLQDFQQHATEFKTDALPVGTYFILASIDPDFSLVKNIIAKQITYISNISYLNNNKDELYVLNRDNGQPLSKATVQVWQQGYNYTERKYEEIKKEKYSTDANGYIKLKRSTGNYNFFFQVTHNNDELFLDESHYSYYNSYQRPTFKRTFLFTDRSIYRPGQTVFFKGIVVNTDSATKKSTVVAGYKTSVILYDANNQQAGIIKLTSNEYGSYNGSFKLPEGTLNGLFYIRDSVNQSVQYINVEEYKRPKFFVEIKKPTGTYRLNDSIRIEGTAKAYAGNNIDGAKVTYRIIRKVRYPEWWGWGSYRNGKTAFPTSSEEMEITNGETITDATGTFSVTFKAIPDETTDKQSQPVFYYEVSADITDINGETRSGNTDVAVAYQMLQLNITAAEKMPADSLKNIKISSTNLNGLYEKSTIKLTVYSLQSPTRIFRERYWEMPDQFIMNKSEYYTNFPYDVYGDEDQMEKWALGQKVIDVNDTTNSLSTFNIPLVKLNAGWYKIIGVTKDKYGEDVKAEKYIRITDKQQTSIEAPVILNIENNLAAPGEKINYTIQTGFDKIWLIHSLNKKDKEANTAYPTITPSAPFKREIIINEDDRGGMSLSYAFVQHNRVYSGEENISIPWSNKDLKISYETFRDKILPGSEEKWTIKITGDRSGQVAAETLVSMYDASLDQFKEHHWFSLKSIWPVFNNYTSWTKAGFASISSEAYTRLMMEGISGKEKSYDQLMDNGWNGFNFPRHMRLARQLNAAAPMMDDAGAKEENVNLQNGLTGKVSGLNISEGERDKISIRGTSTTVSKVVIQNDTTWNSAGKSSANINDIKVRKNFNETAFFFPDLKTDASGNVAFSFTIPEALTQWKLMTLAHSKELASGYGEKTVITQKPLMVQPNAPRFLREGDRMEFSAKVVNLTDSEITGNAQLELFDAANNRSVDGWFKNMFPVQYFTVAAGLSVAVMFPIDIPFTFNSALSWRIKAISKDGSFSDGEEAALPVLTNRMLVTESVPLNMRRETTKNFKFDKLLNSSLGGSLTNHALTVEYTSNPAWYAVQALPYLMEFPYECAEQNFNRYYANTLASFISNSTPKIKAVFEKWRVTDTSALLSNLQKNEALKSALLEETPWVLNAQSESQQKKNMAMLFDMVRMGKEKDNTLNKLKEMQSPNGGFTWFKGGPDDRYITQYIITGIGHLRKLNALGNDDYNKLKPIVDKALPYLDARLKEEYDNLKKYKVNLKNNNLSYTAIQYLYMNSFFPEYKRSKNIETAYSYYRGQSKKFWLSNTKYMQAMIALYLHRSGDAKTPVAIIKSLKENAIYKEEMGMYWKEFTTGGYYWHQAPIESQAMMIEAFTEIEKDNTTIDDLKTWLIKQKQTQNWKTTKATAEACYTLLLNGSNWLSEEKEITITLGNTIIKSTDEKTEAGTGYFKQTFAGDQIGQDMGNITVNIGVSPNQQISKSTSWGAVYWQYFEDLDKITAAETPLKLVKKLFIEKNSERGPVLKALNDGDELQIGDKVKVRIELKVDRDMEYIHMKDMRAACMEPVNVLSEYKWQGGLGYYETTKDASTNFFFGWISRGTYVFEYPMFVTHSGNFSNGITTIQCMYAPEFSSHSNGIRVNVAEK